MNQAHLKKYLDIIQELLTCPHGEEWIRLKQYEDWVNPEFVQVMEQVAAQLGREGNSDAARFLHNWAAKLHHILVKEVTPPEPDLDKSQAYLSLIQALLDCPEGAEQRILAEHQALIGPGLVQKMDEVAQQLQQQGAEGAATYLKNLASELNHAWIEAHAFQPDLQKESYSPSPKAVTHTTEGSSLEPSPQPEVPTAPVLGSAMSTPLTTSLQLKVNQQVADSLREIAQALNQLNQMLMAQRSTESPTTNPLWYMEVLERAHTSKWLMTTEEVEQLIGVKPRCHGDETTYQRGTWQFVKVGKLGTQTAWQVVKAQLEDTQPTQNPGSKQAQSDNGWPKENGLKIKPPYPEAATNTEDVWA